MIKLNLQMFGGGNSGKDGKPRERLSKQKGGLSEKDIMSETDVWSYRHRKDNEPFVDSINTSIRDITDDFPDVMRETVYTVNAAKLRGSAANGVLGYWSPGRNALALNQQYTNIEKMNQVYDEAVRTGYHPGRGGKNGTQAVAYHEMGHALTMHVGAKLGIYNIDDAAKRIVDSAYRSTTPGRARTADKAWAGKISGYAKDSYAECVAEAVADYYCNGAKAAVNSRAIVAEMKRIQGGK